LHSDRDGGQTTRDVSELLADLEGGLRGDRHARAASALAAAKSEEADSLELLAHLERDLRNITRVYRRLLDERNALADRAFRLHKAIRHIEPALGEEPHKDHGVDLGRKGVVQYVADECWRMDNREDWEFEVSDEDGDCPIEQVTYAWAAPRFRVIHDGVPEGDDSESKDAAG
jgi:class 3 adenylate cyclase